MPNTPVQAAGEAMPHGPSLAQTITSLFTRWSANPDSKPGADYSGMSEAQMDDVFAEYKDLQNQIVDAVPTTPKEAAQQIIVATDDGASDMPNELFDRLRQMALENNDDELPVERVERLSRELAKTLPNWAGGGYMAMVYPEGDARGFWFRHISTGNSPTEALGRLRSLMDEAATIFAAHPEFDIERVSVNEHGVHTFLKVPGVPSRGPVDPLLATIEAYKTGLQEMDALTGSITKENEDRLVSETYGPHVDKLMDWDTPAVTIEGAIEALKLMEEKDVFSDDLGKSMTRAVLSFLEGAKA